MGDYGDAPEPVVARLRAICLALPEAHEEQAWAGTRWRVRTKTFAHVMTVEPEAEAAYTRSFSADESTTVVTFRAEGDDLDALRHAEPPFFYAGWGRDAIGLVLDDATDWDEVAELLTDSYCVLAPAKLVALVDRPDPPG